MEVSEHFNYPQVVEIRPNFFTKCEVIKHIATECSEMIDLYVIVYKLAIRWCLKVQLEKKKVLEPFFVAHFT